MYDWTKIPREFDRNFMSEVRGLTLLLWARLAALGWPFGGRPKQGPRAAPSRPLLQLSFTPFLSCPLDL